VQADGLAPAAPADGKHLSLQKALEGPERQIILSALRAHGGNRQATARALDINRTTLYKKMKKYGLME
jgi:DNA-binding NtrC family response regulator